MVLLMVAAVEVVDPVGGEQSRAVGSCHVRS